MKCLFKYLVFAFFCTYLKKCFKHDHYVGFFPTLTVGPEPGGPKLNAVYVFTEERGLCRNCIFNINDAKNRSVIEITALKKVSANRVGNETHCKL